MSLANPKINEEVPSNSTHENLHSTFNKGNHGDDNYLGWFTNHSPNSQCLSSTLSRILYFSLNAAMPLGVSTSLANLPIYSYLERVRRKRKIKSASFRTMDERPKALTSIERRSLRAVASKKIYGVNLNGKFTPILLLYKSGK